MMNKRKCYGLLVVFLLIFSLSVCSVPVEAVVIPLDESGWAIVVNPASLQNGEVAVPFIYGIVNNAVVIEIDKTFKRPPRDGFFDPIVVEFQKLSQNAVSSIIIRDEYIVNNTQTMWDDFHISLIVDVLNPQAGFNPEFVPSGGQLESVHYSGNYGYNNLPIQLNFENMQGPGVPSSPPGEDVFWPGHNSGQIVIQINPDMVVGTRFGLKEVPSIPEPTTIILFGGLGVIGFLKRKLRYNSG